MTQLLTMKIRDKNLLRVECAVKKCMRSLGFCMYNASSPWKPSLFVILDFSEKGEWLPVEIFVKNELPVAAEALTEAFSESCECSSAVWMDIEPNELPEKREMLLASLSDQKKMVLSYFYDPRRACYQSAEEFKKVRLAIRDFLSVRGWRAKGNTFFRLGDHLSGERRIEIQRSLYNTQDVCEFTLNLFGEGVRSCESRSGRLLYGYDLWYRLDADVQTEQYIQAVILPDLQKIVEFLEKAASADGGDS